MRLSRPFLAATLVLLANAAAQAGDVLTAEPLGGLDICSIHGPGFRAIPGTETCLRVSGRVAVETGAVGGDTFKAPAAGSWTSRARGNAQIETQTETDLGRVRTFMELETGIGPSLD